MKFLAAIPEKWVGKIFIILIHHFLVGLFSCASFLFFFFPFFLFANEGPRRILTKAYTKKSLFPVAKPLKT